MREIVPQHGNEAIGNLCAQPTVQRETLKHLDTVLQHEVFVVYRVARSQGSDRLNSEFSVLEAEGSEVARDGSLFGRCHATRVFI